MNDFDFLEGEWTIANRTIANATATEFPSETKAQRLFDGKISLDETIFTTKGTRGLSLRLFNPQTELWSIYWVDSRTMQLDPPVIGRFVDGVGTFIGDDVLDGQPIKLRFTWSEITPESARWQQELSKDDGETWEVNWVMEFERSAKG
ncbi:MAG TPA: hypothetical protein VF062_21230 [Candidatus Limnocylindrales bacterium]